MQLGDARSGKLADNIVGFGRALRRAGVRTDAARMALAAQAGLWIDIGNKADFEAALETVLISREQDRVVFRELFAVYFKDPAMANKLLAQMLPTATGQAEPSKRRPRVREALSAQKAYGQTQPKQADDKIEFDAAMTASDMQRLKHADFNALSASEYHLVERLARDLALPIPCVASRRTRPSVRGAQPHWPGVMQSAARHGGEILKVPRLHRVPKPLPLLVLVDISGSMERYSRLLLSFLHAATRKHRRRDVFAFGTDLTDLTGAFKLADTDAMLATVSTMVSDFAGGTRLGDALLQLRMHHARRLVGRRTMVLLISDGLDTGEPEQLDEQLLWLKRHTRRLLWLNPLLRFEAYAPSARGASVLHQHAHGMLAVHNIQRLEELAAHIAQIFKH